MYAIVDIAGQQFKVEKDQKIYVHRLEGDEGSKVDFDQVLLVDNDGKVQVGTPFVKNTIVTASIVSHLKGDKVKVFKKKRRKGYQVLNGHRQALTELLIEKIGEGVAKAPAAKKAEAPAAKAKTEAKKEAAADNKSAPKAKPSTGKASEKTVKSAATKTSTTTKAKASTTEKKPAAKKPAAKSTAAKKPAAKAAATKKPAAKTAPKTKKADDKKTDK